MRDDISSSARIFAPLGSLSGLSAVSTGPKTSLPFTLQPRTTVRAPPMLPAGLFLPPSARRRSPLLLGGRSTALLSSSEGFLEVSRLSFLRFSHSLSLSFVCATCHLGLSFALRRYVLYHVSGERRPSAAPSARDSRDIFILAGFMLEDLANGIRAVISHTEQRGMHGEGRQRGTCQAVTRVTCAFRFRT